ncbi:MAG: (2Fe-2S) ferredoxin domain-containing protein [Firmicutes bacterium]|jgi:NADH:ubiquinone oxidoreductase subunit E|nr:(2Fe-2S) ferredoxin domain-containing protein [Bacillota bacterium]
MVTVSICVGSSCHLKGAPEVIARFKELIAEHDLWNEVELKGVFCLERCTAGVTVQIGEDFFSGVDIGRVDSLFGAEVLRRLEADRHGTHNDDKG